MVKMTSAELLGRLRAEADRVSGIADRLREAIETWPFRPRVWG
jgi:hypothetical protein